MKNSETFLDWISMLLLRIFKKKRGRKKMRARPKTTLIIDFSNIEISAETDSIGKSSGFSFFEALERAMTKISQDIGPIAKATAFMPEDEPGLVGSTNTETKIKKFARLNVKCRVCARTLDKYNKPLDTTDAEIIDEGLSELNRIGDPENFCLVLASGDKDFAPMLVEAKTKFGVKKIAIIAGSIESLSQELIDLAWRNPKTGKKAVYILPTLV